MIRRAESVLIDAGRDMWVMLIRGFTISSLSDGDAPFFAQEPFWPFNGYGSRAEPNLELGLGVLTTCLVLGSDEHLRPSLWN